MNPRDMRGLLCVGTGTPPPNGTPVTCHMSTVSFPVCHLLVMSVVLCFCHGVCLPRSRVCVFRGCFLF
jgi:hypothetical protein